MPPKHLTWILTDWRRTVWSEESQICLFFANNSHISSVLTDKLGFKQQFVRAINQQEVDLWYFLRVVLSYCEMSHWLSFYNKPEVSFEQSLSSEIVLFNMILMNMLWTYFLRWHQSCLQGCTLMCLVWWISYTSTDHRIIWSYSNRKSGRLVGVETKTAISVPPQFSGLTRFTHERGLVLSGCIIPAGPCRSDSSKNPGSYQGRRLCYIALQRYLQGKDD